MNVMDLLKTHGIEPVRASAAKGGEWHSACPGCGGTDRFHVWPEQNEGAGSYWCRKCGKGGDGLQFLMDFEGCGFKEACERLGRDLELVTARPFAPPEEKSSGGRQWQPRDCSDPDALWQEKAEKFALWCHGNLVKSDADLEYLASRGVDRRTAEWFKLGLNVGKDGKDLFRPRSAWGVDDEYKADGRKKKLWLPRGIVIPRLDADGKVQRIRVRRPAGSTPEKPKYYVVPGSSAEMLVLGCDKEAFVIVEAELDAIAVYAAAGDLVGVVALGSNSARPDAPAAEVLSGALVILDALDYDGAGASQRDWWQMHFPQVERWPVPAGKDPGEAFSAGVNLRAWILEGLPPRFKVRKTGRRTAGPSRSKEQEDFSREKTQAGEVVGSGHDAPGPEPVGDVPVAVFELAQLMRHHPVAVETSTQRLTISHRQEWSDRNWELLGKISDAVYHDPEVFSFFCRLPDGRYNGTRLLEVYAAANKKAAKTGRRARSPLGCGINGAERAV